MPGYIDNEENRKIVAYSNCGVSLFFCGTRVFDQVELIEEQKACLVEGDTVLLQIACRLLRIPDKTLLAVDRGDITETCIYV